MRYVENYLHHLLVGKGCVHFRAYQSGILDQNL